MTLEEIHALNNDFIAFLPQNRVPGQVPFLPMETAEVERRFCQILDEEGYTLTVSEDGTPAGRWAAFDADGNEADWNACLVRARRECGFQYPYCESPTAPSAE